MAALIGDLMDDRLRAGGAAPLLTYYDLSTGERTELSGATFANWVAKTANLLEDLLVGPGEEVALPLATDAPGHWITAIWLLACWRSGAVAALGPVPGVGLVVCGPDWPPYLGRSGEVVACSLRPFPTGLGSAVPAEVTDYDLAVRAQPDRFAFARPDPYALAWLDRGVKLTQADLVAAAADLTGGRRLVRVRDPWTTVRDGILRALVTGGSAVLVVGGEENDLRRLAETERALL